MCLNIIDFSCVQNFVVEVIQFRNSFDASGPAVPGTGPMEAARRLEEFKSGYNEREMKHRILKDIANWFGVPIRPFGDLERTGEVNIRGILSLCINFLLIS